MRDMHPGGQHVGRSLVPGLGQESLGLPGKNVNMDLSSATGALHRQQKIPHKKSFCVVGLWVRVLWPEGPCQWGVEEGLCM